MATSSELVAYALVKGKVRIIYIQSGANSAVQLDNPSGTPSKVMEIALDNRFVAVLGEDGTLGVWSLDTDAESGDIDVKNVWMSSVGEQEDAKLRIRTLRWVKAAEGGKLDLLVLLGEHVARLSVDKLANAHRSGSRNWSHAVVAEYKLSGSERSVSSLSGFPKLRSR